MRPFYAPRSPKGAWPRKKIQDAGEISPIRNRLRQNRPEEKQAEKKRQRYNKIALEAAQQSGVIGQGVVRQLFKTDAEACQKLGRAAPRLRGGNDQSRGECGNSFHRRGEKFPDRRQPDDGSRFRTGIGSADQHGFSAKKTDRLRQAGTERNNPFRRSGTEGERDGTKQEKKFHNPL